MQKIIALIFNTGEKEKWMNRGCRIAQRWWLSRVSLLFTGEGVKTTTENNRRNARTTCFAVNQLETPNAAGSVLSLLQFAR